MIEPASAIHDFFFWGGWSAFVAIGTVGLAASTVWLARQAREASAFAQEQNAVLREQLADAWTREWAAQRPEVYPLLEPDWVYASGDGRFRGGNSRILPLKNGGRGPALNVRGQLVGLSESGNEYRREIIAGTIAPGDLFDARIVPHPGVPAWAGTTGTLAYSDLAGGESGSVRVLAHRR